MSADGKDEKKEKRTPAELVDAIEKMRVDDEVERVLALSDEALDDELRESGLDPEKVRSRGEELGARLDAERTKKPAPPVVPPPPPRRSRWVTLLAAATLGGAAVALLTVVAPTIVARWNRVEPIVADDASYLTDQRRADDLRREAFAACDERRWGRCREKLDEARGLDPAGEAGPRVKEARAAIEQAESPPKPEPKPLKPEKLP